MYSFPKVKDVSSIPSIPDIVQRRKPLSAACMKLLEWILKEKHWSLIYHPPSKVGKLFH